MGFFDKIIQVGDYSFRPGCRISDGSTGDRAHIICEPEDEHGGKKIVGKEPMEFIIEKGDNDIRIFNDGGYPKAVIDKVKDHLREYR